MRILTTLSLGALIPLMAVNAASAKLARTLSDYHEPRVEYSLPTPVDQQESVMRLEARGPEVVMELDGENLGRWVLDLQAYPKDLPLPVEKEGESELCFTQDDRRACARFTPGQRRTLEIAFGGGVISTTIEARRFIPPAVFNAAYQAEHRGRTEVEDPEVYELINVAIAISAFGQAETDLVYHDSDYYRAVQAHFAPFADQPLIEQIDALLREDRANYFPLKMNGYAFVFDNQGHIVRSPVYDRTGFEGSVENALLPLLDDLNEFANASDFRDFYNQNRRIYEGQTLFFEHEAQVSRISSWLSEQFPSVKPYDGVKIVFSPLVAYNQSLTMIEADGYRELQPHVNYPYISKPGLSEAGAVVERSAVLFTEMNHGFVNPVSGRYAGRISAALTDRSMWADDERSASSYQSAESLFDEYMNWGLVSLYDHDVMNPEDFAIAHAGTVENMQTVRGFRKFSGFEAELLRLYRDRVHGQTVEDLYPSIIAWFEQRALATEAGGS